MTEQKKYNEFSLSQAAQFDKQNGVRQSRWGQISADRHAKGISRSARIARGEGKRGGKKAEQAA